MLKFATLFSIFLLVQSLPVPQQKDERFLGGILPLLGLGDPYAPMGMMGGGYGYPGGMMGGQGYPGMMGGYPGMMSGYPGMHPGMMGGYPGMHPGMMGGGQNFAYMCGATCSHRIVACRFICVGNPMSHKCAVCIGPQWDQCKYCAFGGSGFGMGMY